MSFPNIRFGICPVCGAAGVDDPDATDADTSATDSDGHGVVLVLHNGKMMCEPCKNWMINNEQSKLSASKHAEEERFRSKAGFRYSLDDDD